MFLYTLVTRGCRDHLHVATISMQTWWVREGRSRSTTEEHDSPCMCPNLALIWQAMYWQRPHHPSIYPVKGESWIRYNIWKHSRLGACRQKAVGTRCCSTGSTWRPERRCCCLEHSHRQLRQAQLPQFRPPPKPMVDSESLDQIRCQTMLRTLRLC